MTADDLSQIGQRLYGARWKAPLARDIGVVRQTVSAWASNKKPIPKQTVKTLQMLDERPRPHIYRERRPKAEGRQTVLGPDAQLTLIHGDARQPLPSLAADIGTVITDPVWPNALKGLHGAHGPLGLLSDVLGVLPSSVKRIVIQMRCDSDPFVLSAVPRQWPFLRMVWLPYAIPSPQGRLLISGEVGYVFGTPPKPRENARILPGQPHVDFCPKARPSGASGGHPCPRSLEHVEWLVEKLTEPGETVLDPFMGSGTTGVACVRRGRRFVGIEIDPRGFAEAQARLEAECQQGLLR